MISCWPPPAIVEEVSTEVFTAAELIAAQRLLRRMPVGDSVVEMILDLVRAFRPQEDGASRDRSRNGRLGSGARVPRRR